MEMTYCQKSWDEDDIESGPKSESQSLCYALTSQNRKRIFLISFPAEKSSEITNTHLSHNEYLHVAAVPYEVIESTNTHWVCLEPLLHLNEISLSIVQLQQFNTTRPTDYNATTPPLTFATEQGSK